MPIYCYECEKCGHADEEFQSIREDPLTTCPVCSEDTYVRRVAPVHTDLNEYHTPIQMHSIALCHPEDIRAFKRRNPDIECSDDPRNPMCGVPIVKTRKQKKDVLRREGFEEKN